MATAAKPPQAGAICIVLAAGFSQVEADIEKQGGDLVGVPKALLPVAGKPMLDYWWNYIAVNRAIAEVFIVTNALKYKHFERWATAKGIAMSRIVNNGVTSLEHSRGVMKDIEFGIRRAQQTLKGVDGRNLIVLAGDTLFFKDFDLDRILSFQSLKGGSLLLHYGRREDDDPSRRGMCQVDKWTNQVTGFAEKPSADQPGYNFPFVSPLFYIFDPPAWQQITKFNTEQQANSDLLPAHRQRENFNSGKFMEYAVNTLRLPFWGMRMPGAFFMIGSGAGFQEYQDLDAFFGAEIGPKAEPRHIHSRTFARVGIMGNPSDGFHGKTIACTIKNFWASVELWESERLTLLPHPLYDPSSFSGLSDLHFIGRREGYYGGTRLLMATCKCFQELCTTSGIALPRKNFTAKYDTNIPRQVGLAGSSAIVCALFKALMDFYDLSEEHIPLEKQPSFVLSVEEELGIQAGLQDRVVQVYKGLVYMDFDADYMKEHGHGLYERLPREVFAWVSSLPLFLAYEADPSDSGKIHSNVRARWDLGDQEVVDAMKHFADLTVKAREAMERRDHAGLADLMDENFATRRKLYGDAALGKNNLRMTELCQMNGAAVKFPGSGGAVLGLCRPASAGEARKPLDRVRDALEAEGFVLCPLEPVMPDEAKEVSYNRRQTCPAFALTSLPLTNRASSAGSLPSPLSSSGGNGAEELLVP